MHKSFKLMAIIGIGTAILTTGQSLAQTVTYDRSTYGNPAYRSQTTQPYNEIRSELSYAKVRADGTMGPRNSGSARSVSNAMERALAYRDAGDMKNACRWATRALDMAYRAGLDRNSPMFADIIAQQAEFCSAAA